MLLAARSVSQASDVSAQAQPPPPLALPLPMGSVLSLPGAAAGAVVSTIAKPLMSGSPRRTSVGAGRNPTPQSPLAPGSPRGGASLEEWPSWLSDSSVAQDANVLPRRLSRCVGGAHRVKRRRLRPKKAVPFLASPRGCRSSTSEHNATALLLLHACGWKGCLTRALSRDGCCAGRVAPATTLSRPPFSPFRVSLPPGSFFSSGATAPLGLVERKRAYRGALLTERL